MKESMRRARGAMVKKRLDPYQEARRWQRADGRKREEGRQQSEERRERKEESRT